MSEPLRKTLTRIALDLAPANGGTDLTLTHEGVFEDYATRTEHGWGMILDALARALAA